MSQLSPKVSVDSGFAGLFNAFIGPGHFSSFVTLSEPLFSQCVLCTGFKIRSDNSRNIMPFECLLNLENE